MVEVSHSAAPTAPTAPTARCDHLLFGLVGIGTSYVVPVGLFLQIPTMQTVLPEGVKLASSMNVAVNCPIAIATLYVIYKSRSRWWCLQRTHARAARKLHRSRSVWRDCLIILVLLLNLGAALLATVGWRVTFGGSSDSSGGGSADDGGGTSLVLFLACALAGMVGSMSAVILMPWVSRHSANLIPAVNTGSAASMLLLALVDAIEGPGEATPRFGATVFFGICALLTTVPLVAYAAIQIRHQSLARAQDCSLSSLSSSSSSGNSSSDPACAVTVELGPPSQPAESGAGSTTAPSGGSNDSDGGGGAFTTDGVALLGAGRPQAVPVRSLWHYCALNFAVNFVCWGAQPALIPIAARSAMAAGADGPLLQACTMASALCVTLGHFTTSRYVSYRLNLIVLIYMLLTAIFLLAAFEAGDWRSTGGAVGVALLVSASRFIDGLFGSLISLEICAAHVGTEHAMERKEHVLRVTGSAGSIGTLVGSIVAFTVVSAKSEGGTVAH